jgi:hypothetical protein
MLSSEILGQTAGIKAFFSSSLFLESWVESL